MKRVVVTGISMISPIGQNWDEIYTHLKNLQSGVIHIEEWDKYEDLRTRVGSPVKNFKLPPHYGRKQTRSMGRVSQLSVRASELALEDAGLLDDPEIQNGCMGISYGSSSGSPEAIGDFANVKINHRMDGVNANTYIKMMPHTTAVNIDVYFKLKGRIITTSSACTSASQGIGYAYEAIKYGMQTMMLAGGAEELDVTQAAVFDTLFATSTVNDNPQTTPKPFDRDRDGLVIGEGAATFVLEELEHAKARGAKIYAEIIGFHTNSDGCHVTQPSFETMQIAMEQALLDANLPASEIGYINAHGTATPRGDVAESKACENVYGRNAPISSLKSYMGHTLGACGGIEAGIGIHMMNNNWFAPTINLKNIDEECADIDYIVGDGRVIDTEHFVNNNFAFGGINASIIFKRWS